MQIINIKIDEIKPYEKNPRKNKKAIEYVKNSIKEFGFKVPLVVTKDYVIVTGHTRYEASKLLGYTELPCIIADELSEEQITAFRIADNKVGEMATWDYDKLSLELDKIEEIDMELMNFIRTTEFDWDSIEDLTEDTYKEPDKKYMTCPYCQHRDFKIHFKTIKEDAVKEETSEVEDENIS